ncbi:glycosyltransferase involved in cell wall biosynthesis [Rhodanobacter sp. K2T2]|uniref:glycosyltransferase n=1 Tax=Rhodanobacter sp. K2T2 TaxID=2723085 RepID=UPI0018441797|nr:glycosyltransferase involved in cell wall biosynthesis [Rhodanobacter sp. K2T2]
MTPESPPDKRKTLLVISSTYPRWADDHEPGFVHELAKRLTSRFRVIALVPSSPGASFHEILDGVEVIRFRYAPRRFETLVNDGGIISNLRRHRWKMLLLPTFVLGQSWRLWRLSRRAKVDVLHAHWLLPQGLIAALLNKFSGNSPRYLVTSHGADLFALRGKLLNELKRFVVKKAAAVTVVSEAMRTELAHIGADVRGIHVRAMGVDLQGRFLPDGSLIRSRNEILFVGRFVEKKGLRYLIDAMPAILQVNPSAFLTVVGFGPEADERKEQVRRLGLHAKVQFLGAMAQQDLPAFYRRAAMFVAPFISTPSGDQEGLGLVAVEAAGCGCPVIASDLPAVRDVFDESQALLVEAGSVAAITDAVCALFASPPTPQSQEGLRLALSRKFDWSIVAENYSEIIQNVVSPREHKA